jgi:hypothetical protein
MMGKAPIRYELKVRPLERATSPGHGAVVERGTWRFLSFSIFAAPEEGMIGQGGESSTRCGRDGQHHTFGVIPTDMIV